LGGALPTPPLEGTPNLSLPSSSPFEVPIGKVVHLMAITTPPIGGSSNRILGSIHWPS